MLIEVCPEALLRDLHGHACLERNRGVTVAKRVELDCRQASGFRANRGKVGEPVRMQRAPGLVAEDVIIASPQLARC